MDFTEDVEPVTALRRDASELISRTTQRQAPIAITQNGKPTAILQDVASYQRQQRALQLLRLAAQGERDFEAGRVHDSSTVDTRIRERIARHRRGA